MCVRVNKPPARPLHARIAPPLALGSARRCLRAPPASSYTPFFSLPPLRLIAQEMPKTRRGSDSEEDSRSKVSRGAGAGAGASVAEGFRKPTGARPISAHKKALATVATAQDDLRRAITASNDAIVARDNALAEVARVFGPNKGPPLVQMIGHVFVGGKVSMSEKKAVVLGTAVKMIAEQLKKARASQEAKDTLKSAKVRVAPPHSPFLFSHPHHHHRLPWRR